MKIAAKLAYSRTLLVLGLSLGLGIPAVFAQNTQAPPPTTVLPPPAMNDPGVVATTPPATKPVAKPAASAPANGALDLRPQKLPPMKDGDPRMGRPDDSVPTVNVRKAGDATVQEYSRSGQVYMVVVTPKSGIQQTYMVDANGRLIDEHGQKPVGPVMYKVMEWGKAPPPASDANPAPDAGGN